MLLRAHGVRTLDAGDAAGSEGRGIHTSEGRGIHTSEGRGIHTSEGRGIHTSEGRGIAEGACGAGLTQIASVVAEAAPVTVAPSLLWLTGQQVDAALLRGLRPHQRINKFPGATAALCNKIQLWRAFRSMELRHGAHAYGYMPRTFVLPSQLEAFTLAVTEACTAVPGAPSLWILKPAAAQCGGGIRIFDAACQTIPADLGRAPAVVCAYIHPPYLLDGLKFDLRLYVLVTRWQPHLTAYVHRSGIVRRATEPYSLGDLSCRQAHLTNFAVNKTSPHFVADEGSAESTIWPLEAFRHRLESEIGSEAASRVWAGVDDIISKTLLAAAPTMRERAAEVDREALSCEALSCEALSSSGRSATSNGAAPPRRGGSTRQCFQLFGFDVMLDRDARPYLLEVNGDPGLRTESAIFLSINAPMLADLLNLVGVRRPPHEHSGVVAGDSTEPEEVLAAEEADRYEHQIGWRRLLPLEEVQLS